MSDPEKPRKGRFQPGNQFGKGRQKGSQNKFGPNLREKLLAGIAASGLKKAKKAGVNAKVDGTEYFIEALMENTAAASALLSKLIPPETAPAPYAGPGIVLNVAVAAEGQQFLPGNQVLAPLEFAREAWLAYNAGGEAWQAHLTQIEGQLTRSAFENLSRVPPHERKSLLPPDEPLLRLVQEPKPAADPEVELTPQDERMLVELLEQFRTLATRYGIDTGSLSLPGGDDAA